MPTVMIDEPCETIDLARDLLLTHEVNSESNPDYLTPFYLDKTKGRVRRLSVRAQSFNAARPAA